MRNISTNPHFETNVLEPGEKIDLRHLAKHLLVEARPVSCYIKPDGAIHTNDRGEQRDAPSLCIVATDGDDYVYLQISAPMLFPVIHEVSRMLKADDLWKDLELTLQP